MYPQNTDIEKSVLGCLMLGKLDYIAKLDETDFLNDTNKTVFKGIQYMYNKKQEIDVISVSDTLKKRINNSLEYIVNLTDYVATPENMERYLSSLKMYSMRRNIIMAADRAKDAALTGDYENTIELKNNIQQLFDLKAYESKKSDCSISGIMSAVISDIETKMNATSENKLFTGFYELDRLLAGLHTEELTLIAARPGVGKTAFAIQIMLNLAKKGNHCLFVSREMSNMQIVKRIVSNMAEVDGHKLRLCKSLTDEEFNTITRTSNKIAELPIEINDKLSTIQEIRGYCRELKQNDKIDVLILDYLQLCKSLKKTESRRQEVEDISRQLKEMSLEFGIPVIALSQLSRDSVTAGEPELHHLRESGSLEQDADNVIFLHVPKDTNEQADMFEIKIIVAKQRNGAPGYIMLRYYRRTFRLCNLV
jgi:replicative DNA helicase